MWFWFWSCDNDFGSNHMIMMVMHPWIPVQNKMADEVNLSFPSFNHKYYWNMMSLCSKNCFKVKFVDLYTLFEGNKAAGKQTFQFLISEVVDSEQWRISFCKGVGDWVFYPLILVQITSNLIWVFIRVSITKLYCQLLQISYCFPVAALQNEQNYHKVGGFSQ